MGYRMEPALILIKRVEDIAISYMEMESPEELFEGLKEILNLIDKYKELRKKKRKMDEDLIIDTYRNSSRIIYMRIIGFIVENCDRETVYTLGQNLWDYNMVTVKNVYNSIYYGIKYSWKYREKLKQEIMETWDKHNLTWKLQNMVYNSMPRITYST